MTTRSVLAWVALAVCVGAAATCGPRKGEPPEETPPPPAEGPMAFEPEVTDDNREEHAEALRKEGEVIRLSGPETMGTAIEIAGRSVQLPSNAYVKAFVVAVDCDPEQFCPEELPALIIERDEARVWVGYESGKVLSYENAKGRETLFDFVASEGGQEQ